MKLDPYLTPYTKIYSKQIKNLNIRPKTTKRKHNKKILTLVWAIIILAMILKAKETKAKIDKWDCIAKETIN